MTSLEQLRAAVLAELYMHDYDGSNTCLCRHWDGHGSYNGHVTDCLVEILLDLLNPPRGP